MAEKEISSVHDFLKEQYSKSPFDVVLLDPIYKVLTGDENNANDVKQVFIKLETICKECDASLIFSHHHSKGSQGGKSAMDRNSGSGVWARSPDALVDMLELEVVEAVQNEIRDRYRIADGVAVVGLRIEYVLRSFGTPPPETAFYCWPVHFLDADGILSGARSMRAAIAANDRAPAASLSWTDVFDQSYRKCSELANGGRVTFNAFCTAVIATGKSKSEDTIRKYISSPGSGYHYFKKTSKEPAYIVADYELEDVV